MTNSIYMYTMPFYTYRGIWTLLLIAHMIFVLKSISKLILVLKEKGISTHHLRKIFWVLVVIITITLFLFRLHGWSEIALINSRYRIIFECLNFINNQLFTVILLTTYFIVMLGYVAIEYTRIEALPEVFSYQSFTTSKHVTELPINVDRYYKSLFSICTIMVLGLPWLLFCIFRNLNGNSIYYTDDNKEGANKLNAYRFYVVWYHLFLSIKCAFNVIEMGMRMWLVKMMCRALWKISAHMNKIKSMKIVRKHKIMEWIFFIFVCVFVVVCMGIISLSSLKATREWNNWVSNWFIPNMLSQKYHL